MSPRQKVILFAIAPLFLAFCAISFGVLHQAKQLAQQQRATVEAAYLASKETELKHYVALGLKAIAPLYDSGNNDEATQKRAQAILSKMDYGDDGYFFIYDLHGTNLMHPRLPGFVGKNLWELRDAQGNPTIQKLIAKARAGGGLERYWWEKPSLHKEVPKLGYVVMLDRWGWMMGTGIYLDDVDAALQKIDEQNSRNIQNTMLLIAAIAAASIFVITITGLLLNLSELRVADAKLKVLAQRVVRSQEEERARLSRDLHDGISQELVSIKLQVEAGIAKLADVQATSARPSFERAEIQLNHVLGEVRRISHGLRPAILDDLGLAAALDHLAQEFGSDSGLQTEFIAKGSTDGLSPASNTVLFRIAQEALTNIKRHANATKVQIHLIGLSKQVELRIIDDGHGFAVARVDVHPKHGIGLRNMHERVESVGGRLSLVSIEGQGTRVIAVLPRG
ncbi:MAG: cache domain-containing protein [Burkholderiaceae bacterium]